MVSATVRERSGLSEKRRGGGLEELYRQHAPKMIGFAYLLTQDRGQAEDLVQDAFVKVAGKIRSLRDPEAFEAYLRRTVVNLHTSALRRKKLEREHLRQEASALPATRTPATSQPDLGDRDELRVALHTLPARQRAAIVLRYYADLSERQAANELGCSEAALRSLVLRGMETLRGQIRGDA